MMYLQTISSASGSLLVLLASTLFATADTRTLRYGETLSIEAGKVAVLKCSSIYYIPAVGENYGLSTRLKIFATINSEVEVLAPVDLEQVCPVIPLNTTVGLSAGNPTPPVCEFTIEGPLDFELVLQDNGSTVTPQDYKADVIVEVTDNTPCPAAGFVPNLPVPGSGVFVPANTTGPVELILESAEDLISWSPSAPGLYGASADSRFFRLRLVGDLPQAASACLPAACTEELAILHFDETLSIPDGKIAFFKCAYYYYDSGVDSPTEVDEILLSGTINSEVVVIEPTRLIQFCPVTTRGGNSFTTGAGPVCNFFREGPIDFHLSVQSGSTFSTLETQVLIGLRDKVPPAPTGSSSLTVSSNAAVIPADATGPVEVKVEISTDGQTWTGTTPGVLPASTQDRVFRVRTIQN